MNLIHEINSSVLAFAWQLSFASAQLSGVSDNYTIFSRDFIE
jgi:hypothetical protein